MSKKVKNFFWKVVDAKTIAALSTFIKLAVVRGVHHNEVLHEIIDAYNRRYISEESLSGVRLVDEQDLLAELEKSGLRISHTTLMKYKRDGVLDGPACYSNGFRVVYNLDIVRQRVKKMPGVMAKRR